MKLVWAAGIGGGFHRSCVGVTDAAELELKSLTNPSFVGSRGWNGSCVTDGLIRYNQLLKKVKTNPQIHLCQKRKRKRRRRKAFASIR
jgi:hypothetical protein